MTTSHAAEDRPYVPRRTVLGGLAALCLTGATSPSGAQTTGFEDAFLSVSKLLTGRSALDSGHAKLLRDALIVEDPGFPGAVRALADWISARQTGAGELQRVLDAEKSPFAYLPRRIVKAWYTGVVGEGARERCISFETSLMHQLVADKLAPPSYCYGPAGAWVQAPA